MRDSGTLRVTGVASALLMHLVLLAAITRTSKADPILISPATTVSIPNNTDTSVVIEASSTIEGATVNITFDGLIGSSDVDYSPYVFLDDVNDTVFISEGAPLGHFFVVIQLDDGSIEVEVIRFEVEGVDLMPIFTEDLYNFTIDEDATGDYPIGDVSATDEGAVTYKVTDYLGPSPLPVGTSITDIFNFLPKGNTLLVVDPAALDRETQMTYIFNITATDTSNQIDTATVNITLLDVNDEPPVFTNPEDQRLHVILESTNVSYVLFNVTTSDKDLNEENRAVSYTLEDASLPFAIDNTSGIITVDDVLSVKDYSIVVLAMDGGTPSLTSSATFTVQVEPHNYYSPVFVGAPYTATITEEADPYTQTFMFVVSDTDVGPNGIANVSLVESLQSLAVDLSYFYLDNGNTQVVLNFTETFDRENISSFDITVVAYDTGYVDFQKTSETVINVTLDDINDHTPQFTNEPYQVNLTETAGVDHPLNLKVTAGDADIGTNAQIYFRLLNGTDTFSISNDGVIVVKGELERKTTPVYILVVEAYDGGTPNNSNTTYVRVDILEVNTHSPEINGLDSEIDIKEDTEVGYVIANITVTDNDGGPAGEVALSVDGSPLFEIVNSSFLVLAGELDYENTSSYTLTVVARDYGDPVLNSTVIVTVTVDDINEFAPVFSEEAYETSVTENDIQLLQVVATDQDGRDNSITYSISHNYNLSTVDFSIHNATGWISRRTPFQNISVAGMSDTYILIVSAEDDGKPNTSSTLATVVIDVFSDTNFYSPNLTETAYSASIDEELPVGTPILSITATDADLIGPAAQVSKFVLSGADTTFFWVENLAITLESLEPMHHLTTKSDKPIATCP